MIRELSSSTLYLRPSTVSFFAWYYPLKEMESIDINTTVEERWGRSVRWTTCAVQLTCTRSIPVCDELCSLTGARALHSLGGCGTGA